MIDKKILKKLKLIVFDLDGTLLDEYDTIGKETVGLIQELKELGVRFSLASGRLLSAITYHAETLGLTTPIISLDGALIRSYPEKNIIHESYIKEKYVNKVLDLADKYLLNVALCHGKAIYYTEDNSVIPKLIEKYGAKFQQVDLYEKYAKKTLEIIITGDHKKSVQEVIKKTEFPYSFGLTNSFYKSHHHDSVYYLEIRNRGNSKGEGLKLLSKHLKVKIKETAVLGDWYNDKSLFETNALKIAVANAVQEIKDLSDYVLEKTNNEDATAEFLQMVLEAKKS